ncbi:NAD(P)H:quinone oxidoreductase [Pseudoroseomonas wenyumeiae]|uniref:NAD(P)H:quinone oxidoreductase n=1 Tax=Teichococcus wenyumeiae TaxID=2478470 RepID=A0A3A9J625_9PROT|nr:NAD(P)H:quinone oxidoreductase [Pseudoroseomonas wenyumeiae]RKK02677.1 NAD(P)H:quinone oxidoreductase [Pseudoroseomonas wenyumeiae]RMI17423.1 NAD(P)H:quinone oxidoreductase [Pseudoroseomonas wenyumeiae]
MVKIAIVYYSSTGGTHRIAMAAAEGAASVGGEVRVRKAAELAPEAAIDGNPLWRAHVEATQDVPVATPDDLEWADGFLLGTPTRFGLPAAQLKQFIDLCGGKWFTGKLQDKAAGAFGGAGNIHGGQEATLLALQNVFYHWGAVIVPVGYTDPSLYAAGGNPYGVSFTDPKGGEMPAAQLAAARFQGERIARYAAVLSANREALSPMPAKA